MMVIAELNLDTIDESRDRGTVLSLLDSRRTRRLVEDPEILAV